MNCCRETAKMGVPARHLPARASQWQAGRERSGEAGGPPGYRRVLVSVPDRSSQGPTPEDARKDGHIIRARCAPLSPASGFPVSWSQQVIHEISGLE
jgi:hypothetical protein